MAEVVAAKSRLQALPLPGTLAEGGVRRFLLPGIMAVVCLVCLVLTSARLGDLRYWSEIHDGQGSYRVRSCVSDTGLGADRWRCDGALVVDGSSVDVRAELVTSLGAFASHRPFVGEQADVFFDQSDLGAVYPLRYRPNELARLYLSMLPRLLACVGAAIWLAGWYLSREIDPADVVALDSIRFPRRLSWQTRGLRWIVAAVGFAVFNHLVATRVIGSLATF
jgi:hypothetical protein